MLSLPLLPLLRLKLQEMLHASYRLLPQWLLKRPPSELPVLLLQLRWLLLRLTRLGQLLRWKTS